MDCVVIGGGIIGQTIALRLGAAGHGVRLVAPAEEPHMASTGNAGTVAAYAVDPVGTPGVLRDLPRLLFDRASPLAIHRPSAPMLAPWLLRFLGQSLPRAAQRNREALAALLAGIEDDWRALATEVGGTGLIRDRGALYAYDTAEAAEAARPGLMRRRALGASVEMLDRAALHALEPALPEGRFGGAALFPGTLWFTDPARMLALVAARSTATRIAARATGLARRGAGWRVTLDSGERLETETVVVAAGAWSTRLLRPLGLRIPLDTERGYHLEFDLPEGDQPLTRPLCPVTRGFYFTPMQGRLRAAGTVELGGIGKPPSPHRWARLEEGARSVFPDLPAPARRWMGLRPSIPDSLPVIGMAQPGLVLAFGHGHIGLTLAPKTAALVERALSGRETPASTSPHRF
ncbi:MAG: FAD-dependent oxidoreductase [Pararhodobacter sp.]